MSATKTACLRFDSRSGFTPWRLEAGPGMMLFMDYKTWFVEMEVAACFVAFAILAFSLMLGNTLWKSVAGEWQRNTFPILCRQKNK
jgi:hypothetical protein